VAAGVYVGAESRYYRAFLKAAFHESLHFGDLFRGRDLMGAGSGGDEIGEKGSAMPNQNTSLSANWISLGLFTV
jgi:hypothetical protein